MKQHMDILDLTTIDVLLGNSIIDVVDAVGFSGIKSFIKQLPKADKEFLLQSILKISVLDNEQYTNISNMLAVKFHPSYSDESWDCTVCQKKGLDYSRGCPKLDPSKRDKTPILPKVGAQSFVECPVGVSDDYVAYQAYQAYNFLNNGMMPEAGGIGDQTEWFVKVSLLYKSKLKEAENLALEMRQQERK